MSSLAVIVPTRDRPAALRACLLSLQRQELEGNDLRIVVVDDAPRDDVREVAAEVEAAGPLSISYLRQQGAGLNSARNLGVQESDTELVAFLDDDTIAARGWAAAVIRAFAESDCAAIGGRVELSLESDPPVWLEGHRSYLSEFELGPRPRWLGRDLVPVGANCAVRRPVIDAVGGFRPGLDRFSGSLVSNGDTEFFRRVCAAGLRVLYVPEAHVRHVIGSERLTLSYFRARAHAQGVSDEILMDGGSGRRLREIIRYGRIVPIAARGIVTGRGLVNARLWAHYCRGRLSVLSAPDGGTAVSQSRHG